MSERKKLIANIIIPCHLFWPFVLSEWVKQKENQKPAERWWWKSFGKWGKHSSWFVWFFVTFLRGILLSTYHIIAVCFIVLLLLLCWFYGITFFITFTFNTIFLVIQGKITFLRKKLVIKCSSLDTNVFAKQRKLHEIYHFETASYGFSMGHLFVSMKRQWLIKLKYVWLAINFQKNNAMKSWLVIFCCCAVTKRSRKFSNFIRSFTCNPLILKLKIISRDFLGIFAEINSI